MIALETGKKNILSHNSNGFNKEKCFLKSMINVDSKYHRKKKKENALTGEVLHKKKCNIKNVHFEEKGPKVKKHNTFTFRRTRQQLCPYKGV